MEFKLLDIQVAQPAFQKIMNQNMPAKIAFRLSRIAKVIDGVFATIEEIRNKLVQKYGAPDNTGMRFTVKPENIMEYQKEFSDLLSEETISIELDPIEIDWLEDLQLTPLEMMALGPFLAKTE